MSTAQEEPPVHPARPTVRELIIELTQIQDELRIGDIGWSQDRAALVYHEARIVNELRFRRRLSHISTSRFSPHDS